MTQINKKGQAVWELLLAFGVISILVTGLLFAAYFLFARAWLVYQTEQALYCVTERKPVTICRARFVLQVAKYLPWGELQVQDLRATSTGARIRANWRIRKWTTPIHRNLDLSWSKRSRLSHFY